MQTQIESIVETATNMGVGIVLAYITGLIIFPMYDMQVSNTQNFEIVIIFTVVSFFRSYFVRRVFNKKIV